MLQWGRNFIVAEITWVGLVITTESQASMGPQLYRCGNQSLIDGLETPHTLLQWGRNFIVAEMAGSAMGLLFMAVLQWGRNFIVAEMDAIFLFWALHRAASMGPQLYRYGNAQVPLRSSTPRIRFNGAATLSLRKWAAFKLDMYELMPLQWGRNFTVAETTKPSGQFTLDTFRFNGAATLSLRKHGPCRLGFKSWAGLQWGRNFIVAETLVRSIADINTVDCFNGAATLSLRKLVMTVLAVHIFSRFNGAATLSLRKPEVVSYGYHRH